MRRAGYNAWPPDPPPWTEEARQAANFLCSMPKYGHATLMGPDYQSLLYNTGGSLMARGRLCNIKGVYLGAGVYEVRLQESNPM